MVRTATTVIMTQQQQQQQHQQQRRITTTEFLLIVLLSSTLLLGGKDGTLSTTTAFVISAGRSQHLWTTTRTTIVATLMSTTTDNNGPDINKNDENKGTTSNSTTTTTTASTTTASTSTASPSLILNGKRVLPIKILMGGIKGQQQPVAATYAIFSSDYRTPEEWKTCVHIGITRNLQETLQRHMNEQKNDHQNNDNNDDNDDVTTNVAAAEIAFVRALSFIFPNDGAMESIASDWRKLAIDAGGKTNLDPILAALEQDDNMFDNDDDFDDDDDDDDDYFEMMADAMSASRSDLQSARGITVESVTKQEQQENPSFMAPTSPFDQTTGMYRSITDGSSPALTFTRENVDKILEEVRPYLISDGGNVSVERVDETTRNVYLKLQGACGSCPSSTTTMQMGIERVLRENFPNLGQVIQVEEDDDLVEKKPKELTYQVVEQEVNRIQPAIIAMGGKVDIVSVDPLIGMVEINFQGSSKVKKGLELALLDIDFVKQVKFVMDP
jgi:Fe-S cluster biogenesis protein NfuA